MAEGAEVNNIREPDCCNNCKYCMDETCRRHSPRILYGQIETEPDGYVNVPLDAGVWPVVELNDWCGEHERDAE